MRGSFTKSPYNGLVTGLRSRIKAIRDRQRSVSSSENGHVTSTRIDEERHRKQLAILDLFGTIDFDPDYDPIKLRQLDRNRMQKQ